MGPRQETRRSHPKVVPQSLRLRCGVPLVSMLKSLHPHRTVLLFLMVSVKFCPHLTDGGFNLRPITRVGSRAGALGPFHPCELPV